MSRAEFTILSLLLSERREWYGLELVKKSDGALKHGTVYVYLARLEEAGLISSRREQPPARLVPPRRLYKLTGDGIRKLAELDPKGMPA